MTLAGFCFVVRSPKCVFCVWYAIYYYYDYCCELSESRISSVNNQQNIFIDRILVDLWNCAMFFDRMFYWLEFFNLLWFHPFKKVFEPRRVNSCLNVIKNISQWMEARWMDGNKNDFAEWVELSAQKKATARFPISKSHSFAHTKIFPLQSFVMQNEWSIISGFSSIEDKFWIEIVIKSWKSN